MSITDYRYEDSMSIKHGPVNARPAATVILLRDAGEGLQAYLLQRSRKSKFFPGYYVFAGGTVDRGDRDALFWVDHIDLDMEAVAARFGGDITGQEALSYCLAGIRETFEEAGVLMASNSDRIIPEKACENRLSKGLERGWLKDLVLSEGWILNFRSLSRWAHWITPKQMKHHFDTRFFLAIPSGGQLCMPDNREMVAGIWISPEEALYHNLSGKISLSPPTLVTMQELLNYPDTESLKKEWVKRSWGQTRRPRLLPSREGALILQPWDPQIDQEEDIDTKGFVNLILSPGEPFSRLLLHEGIWKPVGIP